MIHPTFFVRKWEVCIMWHFWTGRPTCTEDPFGAIKESTVLKLLASEITFCQCILTIYNVWKGSKVLLQLRGNVELQLVHFLPFGCRVLCFRTPRQLWPSFLLCLFHFAYIVTISRKGDTGKGCGLSFRTLLQVHMQQEVK